MRSHRQARGAINDPAGVSEEPHGLGANQLQQLTDRPLPGIEHEAVLAPLAQVTHPVND
jgi:hypothetical protein